MWVWGGIGRFGERLHLCEYEYYNNKNLERYLRLLSFMMKYSKFNEIKRSSFELLIHV